MSTRHFLSWLLRFFGLCGVRGEGFNIEVSDGRSNSNPFCGVGIRGNLISSRSFTHFLLQLFFLQAACLNGIPGNL